MALQFTDCSMSVFFCRYFAGQLLPSNKVRLTVSVTFLNCILGFCHEHFGDRSDSNRPA